MEEEEKERVRVIYEQIRDFEIEAEMENVWISVGTHNNRASFFFVYFSFSRLLLVSFFFFFFFLLF